MSNMQFANNGIQMNTTIGQPQGQVHAWFIFVIGQDAQSKQTSHLFIFQVVCLQTFFSQRQQSCSPSMKRLKFFGSYFCQMQELGLQALCIEDNGMHKYIRKLLALPLLPSNEIFTQFQRLKVQATTATLQELIKYIEDTWITNIAYPIRDWSVYCQPIRTMNDIESWLKLLSGETGRSSQVPFYTLVQSLHQVAQLSVQNVQLVRNKKLIRIQQQDCHHLQSQISQYWTEYILEKKNNNNKTS